MPSKSRRNRSKHSVQSRKRGGSPNYPSRPVMAPVTAGTQKPVSSTPVLRSPVGVPSSVVKAAAAKYVYVATELRTIGILAATMLIILIVLSKVLS